MGAACAFTSTGQIAGSAGIAETRTTISAWCRAWYSGSADEIRCRDAPDITQASGPAASREAGPGQDAGPPVDTEPQRGDRGGDQAQGEGSGAGKGRVRLRQVRG